MPVDLDTLAFVTTVETSDASGVVGAALITDPRGFPEEFRATTSVRPSAVQKILYGRSLDTFLAVDICGKALLDAITRNPQLIVIDKTELLGLTRVSDVPVALVQKGGESLRTGSEQSDVHRMVSTDPQIDPIVLRFGPGVTSDRQNELRQSLVEVVKELDLTEPFNRARQAVKALAAQESRFA